MGHQQGLTSPSPPAPPGAGGASSTRATYWKLGRSVTACLSSNRILFLDLASDRYLALPTGLNHAFLTWMHKPEHPPPGPCCRLLEALGLAGGESAPVPSGCSVPAVIPVDSPSLPQQRVSGRDLVSITRAVKSASKDVRTKPLSRILAERLPAPTGNSSPVPELFCQLAIFRSARPLIPVPRICLHDCLALADWLGPSFRGASLVFGVSAVPFAAHCWLQKDGVVLDDHPESPSRYRPILHLP